MLDSPLQADYAGPKSVRTEGHTMKAAQGRPRRRLGVLFTALLAALTATSGLPLTGLGPSASAGTQPNWTSWYLGRPSVPRTGRNGALEALEQVSHQEAWKGGRNMTGMIRQPHRVLPMEE